MPLPGFMLLRWKDPPSSLHSQLKQTKTCSRCVRSPQIPLNSACLGSTPNTKYHLTLPISTSSLMCTKGTGGEASLQATSPQSPTFYSTSLRFHMDSRIFETTLKQSPPSLSLNFIMLLDHHNMKCLILSVIFCLVMEVMMLAILVIPTMMTMSSWT